MKLFFLAQANSAHTQRWVSYFAEKGNDITLASFYPGDEIKGVNLVHIPVINKNMALLKAAKVRKLLAEIKPDILHAHYATSCGIVAALTDFHPYVLSTWGDDIFDFPTKSPIHRWIVRKAIAKADYITSTSHMLAKGTNELADKLREIEVIPFGVDLNHYQYCKREQKEYTEIGTVRSLKPKYGLKYLIEAISKLIKQGLKVRLTIVGDGPIRSELEKQARHLKIDEYVTFTGAVPNKDVVNFLNNFDIFVMPSVGEGETFGVAAVEAMATGLPVIASKIGGLPEVVDDEHTGLHVAPGNVNSLAVALTRYANSAELRLKHGQAGREKVAREYDWSENAGKMNQLYEKIMAKSGAR